MASLLEALGNLLDTPGSMVRDAVTLHNPFDQLLDPFGGSMRLRGEDVLHHWGMQGDHPLLGLGVEMATDPLNVIGLGGLGRMGAGAIHQGLKGAGSYSKVGKGLAAAKTAMSSPEALKSTLGRWFAKAAPEKAAVRAAAAPVDDIAAAYRGHGIDVPHPTPPVAPVPPQMPSSLAEFNTPVPHVPVPDYSSTTGSLADLLKRSGVVAQPADGFASMAQSAPSTAAGSVFGHHAGFGGFSNYLPPAGRPLPAAMASPATAGAPLSRLDQLINAVTNPHYQRIAKGLVTQSAMDEARANQGSGQSFLNAMPPVWNDVFPHKMMRAPDQGNY